MPRRLFLTGVWLLASAAGADLPPTAPRVWRAGVETLSEPFTFADARGQPAGFAVDLLQAVAAEQGLQIEYSLLPREELLAAAKAGRIDIVCNVADTPERRKFLHFSVATLRLPGRLYYHRTLPAPKAVADLAGRKLAVPRDSRAHEYVRDEGWNLELVFLPALVDCVRAVQEGQADLVMANGLVTDRTIHDHHFDAVVPADLVLPKFEYRLHFAVPPDRAELLAQLNEGLAAVDNNGTYDRLHEKWLGPLEPRRLHWRDLQPFLLPLTVLAGGALAVLLWQRRLLRQVSRQAREIRENEERLRLVFDGSQDGFWDWDIVQDQVMRSPRWSGMLGFAPGEVAASRQAYLNLVHPDDRPRVEAEESLVLQGRDHFSREVRMRTRAGEWKWILDRGTVVARDPATGAPRRITGTHTDITERKRSEEAADKLQHKMQEAQKLESLGVLAGGIAHDFNNLLTVILGNSSLARIEAGESAANVARLDSVITSAHRAAELCRQLLDYAGKGSYSIERLNLNNLITETTQLLQLSIGKHARLEFALAPTLPRIEADSSQLRQIIMNIVINASEALADSPGTIRLATSVMTMPRPGKIDASLLAEVEPGDYVCLEVADTGCGMSPEVRTRIFDPFFTTKFAGRGLGLAAVLGIVRTHGGTVEVQSAPGEGSVFRIYLPVSQKQTATPFPSYGV